MAIKTYLFVMCLVLSWMCGAAYAVEAYGGDDGYVLSPLPSRVSPAPRPVPQAASPTKASAPRAIRLPEVDPGSAAGYLSSVVSVSGGAVPVRRSAVAPAGLPRSRFDRPAELDDEDEASGPVAVEGSVVLPYAVSGESASGGRINSTDPYYSLDVTAQIGQRGNVYGSFWQGTTGSFNTDEIYGTAYLLADDRLNLSYGRLYLPFGAYATGLLSSPLTESLGSLRNDRVVMLSSDSERYYGNLFFYRSDAPGLSGAPRRNRLGFDAGVQGERGLAGLSYLGNLADSDAFWPHDVGQNIPGIALYGQWESGPWMLSAEYLKALRDLQPGDLDDDISQRTRPAATHFEVSVDVAEDNTLALSWSETRNAQELFLDRSLWGLGYAQHLWNDIYGAVEVSQTKDEDGEENGLMQVELEYSF